MYGPVVTQLAKNSSGVNAEALTRALTSQGPLGEVPSKGTYVLKSGRAEGPLVGGCISLINSSIGTPYELKTDGAILFLEDTGEKVYVLEGPIVKSFPAGHGEAFVTLPLGVKTELDASDSESEPRLAYTEGLLT